MKPPVDAPTSRATRPPGRSRTHRARRRACGRRGSRTDRAARPLIGTSGASRSPGLRSPRAASPSPTLTAPARTSAWARLRDSASPRSTSSWSSRMRGGLRVDAGLTRLSWHSPLHANVSGRQPAATSERPGVARSVSSASRTWPARPGASRRRTRRRSATDPWSTNRSPGMPRIAHGRLAIGRVGQPRLLDELEHAAAEPAGHHALLEGHDHPLATGLVEDELAVERLARSGR